MVDQLRSILAQLQFKYEIEQYEAKGILFSTYLYVPEEHPETKSIFYEREDEAHLIKVCLHISYYETQFCTWSLNKFEPYFHNLYVRAKLAPFQNFSHHFNHLLFCSV